MKRKTNIQIFPVEESVKNNSSVVEITGRVLGVLSKIEASKVIMNQEVYSRICTTETRALEDVVAALLEPKDSHITNTEERVLTTVDTIKYSHEPLELIALTRQLFISKPVSLVAETVKDSKTGLLKTIMECDDGSLIILTEEEGI